MPVRMDVTRLAYAWSRRANRGGTATVWKSRKQGRLGPSQSHNQPPGLRCNVGHPYTKAKTGAPRADTSACEGLRRAGDGRAADRHPPAPNQAQPNNCSATGETFTEALPPTESTLDGRPVESRVIPR